MHSNYRNQIKSVISRYCRPDLGYNLILYLNSQSAYKDTLTGEIKSSGAIQDEIRLRVNQAEDTETENTQGSDRNRIFVEGYLVQPLSRNLEWSDRLNGKYLLESNWIDVAFYPVLKLADNLTEHYGLHSHTGVEIEGYLKKETPNQSGFLG